MKSKKETSISILPEIENRIYTIRGMKGMLDFHLAEMYSIETKNLKRQVKRNIERFPEDFMFELTAIEFNSLRSQFGTLEKGKGQHPKYLPFAFTEQGVAMLSSVLNSKQAIAVNIQIMRVFVNFRAIASQHKDILKKLDALENKVGEHDTSIKKFFIT